MKTLSIIIPVYNTEKKYFEKCLMSLKCEQQDSIEIIVVDDGSKEERADVIKKCTDESSLDSYYFRKENGGQNSARAYGLSKASGKYIFFVDADDYLETKCLDNILQILKEKEPPILAFNYDVRTPQGDLIEKYQRWDNIYQPMDMHQGIINSNALWLQIYSTQILKDNKIEFAQGIRIGEDLASATTILAIVEEAYTVGDCLYHYVKYSGSILSNPPFDSALDIVKAFDFILRNLDEQKKKQFHEELEWLAILHVLYYGTERIMINFSGDRFYIRKIREWMKLTYPNWSHNKYLKVDCIANQTKFKMLIKGWIFPVELVYFIKRHAIKLLKK